MRLDERKWLLDINKKKYVGIFVARFASTDETFKGRFQYSMWHFTVCGSWKTSFLNQAPGHTRAEHFTRSLQHVRSFYKKSSLLKQLLQDSSRRESLRKSTCLSVYSDLLVTSAPRAAADTPAYLIPVPRIVKLTISSRAKILLTVMNRQHCPKCCWFCSTS